MNLYQTVFTGSKQALKAAEDLVKEVVEKKGKDCKVAFPDTAYSLPVIYAATGKKITNVGELEAALDVVRSLIVEEEMLDKLLNSGLATAVAAEIIEACKYVLSDAPYSEPCSGFISDPIIRSFGVPLVTGDVPGVAVVLGEFPDAETAAKVIKDYQSKGLLTCLVGKVIDQAIEGKVKMGLDLRVVPLGYDVTSVIHIVSFAIRAALIFGAVKPGDLGAVLQYCSDRVPAFVNAFGPLSELVVSAGAGAIALGFPVITDQVVPEVPTLLLTQKDYDKVVKTSLEARKIKIKITEIPIPVSFAAAFEGERIRKGDMHIEFGAGKTEAWELVMSGDSSEVEDHKIEIIGADIDSLTDVPGRLPMGMLVKVSGANMQKDFEPVLERRLHYFLNYIEGVMHVGQRNMTQVRVGKEAFDKGFRLKHFGEVIYAKMLDEFGSVVDKCEVTLITDLDKVRELKDKLAMPRFAERDERLESLIDENVDTFYSCNLCQSFAPAHVCIVTPERLGLCGAVSWLDAKATLELNPTGPCQAVPKEGLVDENAGVWDKVNETVSQISQGAVNNVTLYSILQDPMTSCGCFECITGIMPEANGVVIVNREHGATTPLGMTFGELASMTGGGVQTPGFMGHGRSFIPSKKFMKAEGGIGRIVWMPKELKDFVAEKLNKTAKELYGIDNFADMICDESIAIESDAVLAFLEEKGHPALGMDPIM